MDQQKLSLIAQYDDLIRYSENLINNDHIEDKIKLLIQNCEKQRLIWLIERNELNESREVIKQLKKENNRLETTLKNVRDAFKNEVNLKEKLKEERDLLISKLSLVQKFLQEDDFCDTNSKAKEKILGSLNLSKMKPINEHTLTDDDSMSFIEFDKTDDDLLSNSTNDVNSMKCNASSIVKNTSPINYPKSTLISSSNRFDIQNDLDIINSKRLSAIQETLIKQQQEQQQQLFNSNEESSSIDNRPHQFVRKKVLRTEKCGVCKCNIGFYADGYHCRDCRAIYHKECKDKAPKPCIPYVSRAQIGKKGKLELISDYTVLNVKPCVPALIQHCCTEIERRGLDEIGLYRISGSVLAVNELKKRMLDSKKGPVDLKETDKDKKLIYDTYTICSVVKEFLKGLDESLITKLAWRDFVTAAANRDDDQRTSYLQELISNLHVANRDTLAYMILHLHKVAESPECKMSKENLAKVFAPTIVGFSMKDPPAEQMHEENIKQIAVMNALFSLDIEFWKNVISKESIMPLMRKDSINHVLNKLNRNYTSNSRMSIGSRLCGGRVAVGTLTPLKSTNLRSNATKSSSIKPLF